jgi:hypothetical protein
MSTNPHSQDFPPTSLSEVGSAPITTSSESNEGLVDQTQQLIDQVNELLGKSSTAGPVAPAAAPAPVPPTAVTVMLPPPVKSHALSSLTKVKVTGTGSARVLVSSSTQPLASRTRTV